MNFKQESQFKETEIGLLPKDWNLITLKDTCSKIGSGITPRGGADVYSAKGTALIRSQNVLNNSFSYDGLAYISDDLAEEMENVTVANQDVLLNITGDSVARCCSVPDNVLPARVNQHVSIIRTNKEELDPIFLKYFLTSSKMQNYMLSLAQSGGTRNALTKGMIENFVIPKPTINEQKVIVNILSAFDSKIELNRYMNRTLEAIGAALFKRWFVNFEFPNQEGKPYKSTGGKMVDSQLEEIPEDWEVRTIGEVLELAYGKPLKETERRAGSIPVYGSNGSIGWHDVSLVHGPGIIVGRKGNPGTVLWSETDFFPIDTTFYVVPKGNIKSLYYLFYALQRQNLPLLSADSAVPGLNRNIAYRNSVLTPSQNVLEKFSELMQVIFQKIQNNKQQSAALSNIRDLLLPRLMSGKIRVPLNNE